MRVRFLKPLLCIGLLALAACDQKTNIYKTDTPSFDPKTFFNGEFKSYGVFRDYKGKAVKRFSTISTASWDKNENFPIHGQMHESFAFTDGTTGERQWQFTQTDAHHVVGTAPDVVGDAVGEFDGNALHWVYKIRLPSDTNTDGTIVHFNDWLYLTDENHMFSFIKISKFGIPVGNLTMFFEKQ